jgi:hypothetical protein
LNDPSNETEEEMDKMTHVNTKNRFLAAVKDFLARAETLAAELDPKIMDTVDEVARMSLPADEAQAMYERVLAILQEAKEASAVDAVAADNVCEAIRSAAGLTEHPETEEGTPITLVPRNGLSPRDVLPVQEFLGKTVKLVEGHVDVLKLPLWIGNDRVRLSVQEFRQRNGREPGWKELLDLMVGNNEDDPFKVQKLAESIKRRGVVRPPIITADGLPKDGNRRIAACKYIHDHPNLFKPEERERARWVRVWQADKETTDDQFEAIVVALNFEDEEKEKWAEYIKARRVSEEYERRELAERTLTTKRIGDIKKEVAEHFSIKTSDVTRYLKMVQWANDFERFHIEERQRDENETRHTANEIFQYFYELDAGRSGASLTDQIQKGDEELRTIVYDLMWNVLDSGALLRGLHKVIAEDGGIDTLKEAHELSKADPKEALDAVRTAVANAEMTRKNRLGLDTHLRVLRIAIDKLGDTPPDRWRDFETSFLKDLRHAFVTATGVIDAELERRTAAS